MFFFVSEPALDLGGAGTASFTVGMATIRCPCMSSAIALSQRIRSACEALARRGRRPRRIPLGLADAADWSNWIDDLEFVASVASLPTGSDSLSKFRLAARDDFDFEAP